MSSFARRTHRTSGISDEVRSKKPRNTVPNRKSEVNLHFSVVGMVFRLSCGAEALYVKIIQIIPQNILEVDLGEQNHSRVNKK